MLKITIKAFVLWLVILVLAIINGGLREALLMPVMSNALALPLSGILLSVLILAVACLTLPWLGRLNAAGYAAIGSGWLSLTLVFEFSFGYLIQDKSWPQLVEAYTFKDGNLWPIVLLVVASAPCVAAKIRHRI
ncbi:hypothetical protein GCM10022421_33730 [Oceanisphaera sediminis]|uniref:Uncharacterized protein n=1 Tax=Oceanisphaera sediminis TaxID=981381 RepID=A0ABP7ER93_9GAMM